LVHHWSIERIGYALSERVLQKGERVVMGARTVGPKNELASRYPDRGLAVELDVTKPDQRASAVQRCEDRFSAPSDVGRRLG